jgi:hypothetical protein
MLLGLAVACAIGVVATLVVLSAVGNPQFIEAGTAGAVGLIVIYGLVPSFATGLASVIGAAVALHRYDPALDHPELIRDRLVWRGATFGAAGAWLALTIILGLASPESWVIAAAMVVLGAAVSLMAGSIGVGLARMTDRRTGVLVRGVLLRR